MKSTARIVIVAVIIGLCAGIAAYIVSSRPPAPPAPGPPVPARPTQPVKPPSERVTTYKVGIENNKAVLRPVQTDVKPNTSPAEAALRALVEQPAGPGEANPIPHGTRILGVSLRDGVASVNLSREFQVNFAGGSEAESLTVEAILRTLAQFPDIKKVKLQVEGRPLGTLGHLDLSGPLDVNWKGSEQN